MGILSIREFSIPPEAKLDELKTYSGFAAIRIHCETPLHIGSGKLAIREENKQTYFIQEFVKQNGKPIIPGSSFKGSLRTYMECLSPKLKPSDKSPTSGHEKNGCFFPLSKELFGTISKEEIKTSRVFFTDFTLVSPNISIEEKKVYPSYQPARITDIKIYAVGGEETPIEQSKKDVWIEYIKDEAEFEGKVYFREIPCYQIGLLIHTLELNSIRIGGKKEQGFGKIKTHIKSIQMINVDSLNNESIDINTSPDILLKTKESYEKILDTWKVLESFQQNLEVLNNAP